jgi:hypothetical protein
MKRAIALTLSAAILACAVALPAIAQPGWAGKATHGGGWKSGYGCASGQRKC